MTENKATILIIPLYGLQLCITIQLYTFYFIALKKKTLFKKKKKCRQIDVQQANIHHTPNDQVD